MRNRTGQCRLEEAFRQELFPPSGKLNLLVDNLSWVRHDRGVVLERVADAAIPIGVRPIASIILLVRVGDVAVPLIAVIFPGNIARVEEIAKAGRRRGWNGERRVGCCRP